MSVRLPESLHEKARALAKVQDREPDPGDEL